MNDMQMNPFEKFAKQWALVCAGPAERFNAMTVSWGSMGTVWGRSVITVYIRPDRHTCAFLKENETFTVSFYPERFRGALEQMGTLSGRDGDKVSAAGLTPRPLDGCVTFAEAEETFVCAKLYMEQMSYDAVPEAARRIYRNGVEPHFIVMGEVTERL